jgi:signal transduction histidine kinase
MAEAATPGPKKDPLLSLGVHEFRTPVTVIAGYLRMLMTGRTGALSDTQRKMLEEMEKSTARLSGLIAEMSELSVLEAGGGTFNRGVVDLAALIEGEIGSLPALPDREVGVTVQNEAPGAGVHGDPVRLRAALNALLIAHRRELVTSDELRVCVERTTQDGTGMLRITIGGADRIDDLRHVPVEQLMAFEEFRGGVGFTLPIARRIVAAHDGQLWSPPDHPRAGAVLFFPEAQRA